MQAVITRQERYGNSLGLRKKKKKKYYKPTGNPTGRPPATLQADAPRFTKRSILWAWEDTKKVKDYNEDKSTAI